MSVTRVAAGSVRTVDVIQLHYAGGRELVPPLVRIGGVIGFIALTLSFLHAPSLCNSDGNTRDYLTAVHVIVPAGQFLLAGGGLAMVIAGQVLSRRVWSLGLLLALAINLAAVALGVWESLRGDWLPVGWFRLSNSI